jgi:alpha-beta hydrolase superfamily lysophospholipase
MAGKHVLFMHGLFMTHRCWDGWVNRFQTAGYTTQAVAYPGRDKSVEELRRAHPDANVGKLTFDSVLAHYTKAIQAMSDQPVLVGHSLGGLLVQVLLNRGLGAVGVAIHSGPPQGLLSLKPSFFRANWPALNPFSPSPYMMPFSAFQYAFVNGMPEAEQRAIYDQHVPPESLGIPRGVLSSPAAKIDYSKDHAPLLMLAGSNDHIIPASLNQTNFARYKASLSITAYKQFAGRNHCGFVSKGWDEYADYVLQWLENPRA